MRAVAVLVAEGLDEHSMAFHSMSERIGCKFLFVFLVGINHFETEKVSQLNEKNKIFQLKMLRFCV